MKNCRYNPALLRERQFFTPHDYDEKDVTFNASLVQQTVLKKEEVTQNSLEKKYHCKNCEKIFPGPFQLRRHAIMKVCIKRKMGGKGDLVCEECGKTFKALSFLISHLEFHKNPEDWKWQCGDCGKKCATKTSLQVHLRKHTKEKPFVCRFCGKKYGFNISLKGHLGTEHGNEKGIEKEIRGKKTKRVLVPQTTKQTKIVSYRKPIRKKTYNVHKVGKFEHEINKERKLSWCQICRQPFPNFKELKKHMESKLCKKKEMGFGVKAKCEECGNVFDSDKGLWFHQSEFLKNKVCLECGKQFRISFNFKLHLEYHKDPKEWKFDCGNCGRKCPSKYKLKEHLVKCTNGSKKRKQRKKLESWSERLNDFVLMVFRNVP